MLWRLEGRYAVKPEADLNRPRIGFADLRIRPKSKQLIPFVPNEVQELYLDILIPGWRDGFLTIRGLREYVLKARQPGISTLVAALFFIDTISYPGTGTVVASYDAKSSQKLFEIPDRMYRHLPPELKPLTQRANTKELYWPEIDCHYEVLTAGSKSIGRSWTINNLHISEYGFYAHPEVVGGLLQAVPADGNIFIESTANGEGSIKIEQGEVKISGSAYAAYYDMYKGGKYEFTTRFFAWFENPEYRTQPPDDFVRTTEEDKKLQPLLFERYDDETRLAQLYGIDDWQLYWRRRKIDEVDMGPAKFCQEYPANDVEAFRTSGKKFFAGLWNVDVHVKELEIEPWWTPLAGFDAGYGVPFCFGLGWVYPMESIVEPDGTEVPQHGVYLSDEAYGARIRNVDQIVMVNDILQARAIPLDAITFYADPEMWAKMGSHQADRVGRADVEDFQEAGMSFMKANNNRKHGCSNMRNYFGTPGAFYVSPRCVNFIRTVSQVRYDPHDLEVYETSETADQHAVDMGRYLLNSRPIAPEKPAKEPVTYLWGLPVRPLKQLPPELRTDDEDSDRGYY